MVRLDADAPLPADAAMAFDLTSSIVTHPGSFEPAEHGTRPFHHVASEAPLGLLGSVVERPVLARYVRRLIDLRNTFLVSEATRLGATMGPGTDG